MIRVCKRGHEYEVGVKCQQCHRIRSDNSYVRNRERLAEKRAALREETRAKARARYAANRDKYCAKVRAYQLEHRAHVAAKNRSWYERNVEYVREANRAWCARNPDKVRAYHQRYHKKNPEKNRLALQRRRARLRDACSPGVTSAEWQNICATFVNAEGDVTCVYCNRACAVTVDHVVPADRGGRDEPNNVLPACKSCNSSKWSWFIWEWHRRKMIDPVIYAILVEHTENYFKVAA
jgi:5-methylcytosine-specific restriction endonuclease McrA